MAENDNTNNPTSASSSKMKLVVVIVIGGIILFVAAGFLMQFLAKKAGTALLQGVIENKTGVKTDFEDIEKGKATFTDTKTGQTVTIGEGKLPDEFPKDFPVYAGAKVVSSVSGFQQEESNGMLVTFTTADGLDKVVPFYKSGLSANGWEITSSFDSDTIQTWAIAKGAMEGSVSITSQEGLTTIQVVLGNKQ